MRLGHTLPSIRAKCSGQQSPAPCPQEVLLATILSSVRPGQARSSGELCFGLMALFFLPFWRPSMGSSRIKPHSHTQSLRPMCAWPKPAFRAEMIAVPASDRRARHGGHCLAPRPCRTPCAPTGARARAPLALRGGRPPWGKDLHTQSKTHEQVRTTSSSI